jgi:hypothetical protein
VGARPGARPLGPQWLTHPAPLRLPGRPPGAPTSRARRRGLRGTGGARPASCLRASPRRGFLALLALAPSVGRTPVPLAAILVKRRTSCLGLVASPEVGRRPPKDGRTGGREAKGWGVVGAGTRRARASAPTTQRHLRPRPLQDATNLVRPDNEDGEADTTARRALRDLQAAGRPAARKPAMGPQLRRRPRSTISRPTRTAPRRAVG